MQVLLTTLNAKYIHINLAIRQLYALNHTHYAGLQWREFTIKEDPIDIATQCASFDVVCFSCYIWNITPTLKVAAAIKQINPNCKIMLGGPEVSYEWQPVIEHSCIDYIIIGEGEIPFNQFLNNYPNVQQVSSLVYKQNGGIHYNNKVESIDVNNYETIRPYIYDDPATLYNRVAYLETSRGCPYKCEFCLASLDNKVRYLPDVHIKETLLLLMNHGKVIKFLDRTFNIKKDFTIGMFDFILKNHKPGNVFQFEITADIVHPDIIKYIDEHVPPGLFRFEIGIQTVNQVANLEVSRKQNFDKTKSIIKQLQHKIEMHLDLIVGLPLDRWADIKYSFEEVFKLFAPELQLGFLKFLKGTPMRSKVEQHGYVYDPEPPYQIIKSNYLSEEELHKITLVEEGLEIYWNKNRAQHTLKYVTEQYGIFDFLLGLASTIYAQQPFHTLRLDLMYTYLYHYAQATYPQDAVLLQLITIDYLTQYKVKPKTLFTEEMDKKHLNAFLQNNGFAHNKFRYRALNINFNWHTFITENKIVLDEQMLLVQFNGTTKGETIIINNEHVIINN